MKIMVNFETSNEEVPCLTVMRDSWYFSAGAEVISVHTGEQDVNLWNKLLNKAKESEKEE